jgi:hypothetical protein
MLEFMEKNHDVGIAGCKLLKADGTLIRFFATAFEAKIISGVAKINTATITICKPMLLFFIV